MTRFAVDGIDCAGKTTFADRLGELLGAVVCRSTPSCGPRKSGTRAVSCPARATTATRTTTPGFAPRSSSPASRS